MQRNELEKTSRRPSYEKERQSLDEITHTGTGFAMIIEIDRRGEKFLKLIYEYTH